MRSQTFFTCSLPVLTALLALAPATAQTPPGPAIGLHAGTSVAHFAGDGMEGVDQRRVGPAIGGLVSLRVRGPLGLQLEVGWVRKGGRGALQGFEESLAVDLEIDYLQVPLLATLSLPALGPLRPVLRTGPTVSFELDCDVRTAPIELAITLGCEPSAPDGARRTVGWGWIGGGALLFEIAGRTLFVDARADLGLTTLDRELDAVDVKNRALLLTVGAMLWGGGPER